MILISPRFLFVYIPFVTLVKFYYLAPYLEYKLPYIAMKIFLFTLSHHNITLFRVFTPALANGFPISPE